MQNPEDVIAGLLLIAWFFAVHAGMAVVLKKVGRPMWFAVVPGLNMYEMCRAARVSGLWALAVFVPLANFGACFYVAIKLAERFGASDWFGIALGSTGFGALPLLAFIGHPATDHATVDHDLEFLPDESVDTLSKRIQHGSYPPAMNPPQHSNAPRRAALVGMIVLSMTYGLCLLCVPGLMIVGVMAFDGVSQITPAMEMVIGLVALVPVSILAAWVGGWVLYYKEQYRWALGLSGLPLVNTVAAFAGFILAFG